MIRKSARNQNAFYQFPHQGNKAFFAFSAGFESEYLAVLQYAVSMGFMLPSGMQQIAQNSLVRELKALDIWRRLDLFYNFCTDADSNFAKINWITPGTYQANGNGHDPTFNINSGFNGNGSSKYLDTQAVLNSLANYSLNSASAFIDIISEGLLSFEFGAIDGTNLAQLRTANNLVNCDPDFNNTHANHANFSLSSTIGSFLLDRQSSSVFNVYRNGVKISAGAGLSSAIPALSMYVGGLNSNGGLGGASNKAYSCFALGSSLEINNSLLGARLYNAWTRYKTNL